MKGKKFFTIFALCLSFCLFFSACASQTEPPSDKQCRVVLSDSEFYTCSMSIQTVLRGSDVEFALEMADGYTFDEANYADYTVDIGFSKDGVRTVNLTLHNVKYSTFVKVEVCPETTCSVSIAPSEKFRCETPEQFVMKGEDAVFTLFFQEDYTLASSDYSGSYRATGIDSEINGDSERRVVLTIENVMADAEITVTERNALPPVTDGSIELSQVPDYAVVGYALNGGKYVGEAENSGSYYTVTYPLSVLRRPNTSIGTDMISRSGYVLTGWNTQPDGSGEHIGLGSRTDVFKNETLVLYAEWAEWTDVSLFEYVVIDTESVDELYTQNTNKKQKLNELAASVQSNDRSAVITGYHGNGVETLVIPERLGGYPVAGVASGAVENDTKIRTVIFPMSIKYVMENAFADCAKFTEVYLYDNMDYIDESSLGEHIETLHINAIEMPIYGLNESAQLANKLEMLMEYEKEVKTIIFGSCSIWYSIHAETFGDATGRPAFNMGVEGETCILVQLDLIKQYMHTGDTLLYMCDIGSPNMLGYDDAFDARTYRMFEFNYDLLTSVNLQRYPNTVSALNEYFITKDKAIAGGMNGTYSDYLDCAMGHGDMQFDATESNHDGLYHFIAKQTLIENNALENTKAILHSFTDMGIDVYYGFGLITEVCLTLYDAYGLVDELNKYFIEQFEVLDMPAKMLGDIYFSILPNQLFYNTPYRLNVNGREFFTQQLIENFLNIAPHI